MTSDELFDNAVNHWRDNKGIGTALIPPPLDCKDMIIKLLNKLYSNDKNKYLETLIVVNSFYDRKAIIEHLRNQNTSNNIFINLLDNKLIKVFTSSYIISQKYIKYPSVIVLYQPDTISDDMFAFFNKIRFRLVVLDKLINDLHVTHKLYSTCPLLSDFKQNELDLLRTSTPIKENRIGLSLVEDSEDSNLLKQYTDYITTSIKIFGSFDNIQYARSGNSTQRISAMQFCNQIAEENGWNDHLDMSIEFNLQIDNLYNPNNIRERALQTYEIIRLRKKLLTSNKIKLNKILEIVNNNKDKKILIINKFQEFAAEVTNFINDNSEKEICANYHDFVEPIPAYDINGEPILIKSGKHKGEHRMLCAKAQKTYNEFRFNNNIINVLSTNNAPDKDLQIAVDIIILTSPECEEIKSYLYRLSNITYPNNEIQLYTLYIMNTAEETKLNNKDVSNNHEIINNSNNENISDFIVVD
jgi:hypothetical protein